MQEQQQPINIPLNLPDCALILGTDGSVRTVMKSIKTPDDITYNIHIMHVIINMLQDPAVFSYARESFLKRYGSSSLFTVRNPNITKINSISSNLIN